MIYNCIKTLIKLYRKYNHNHCDETFYKSQKNVIGKRCVINFGANRTTAFSVLHRYR